MYVIVILPSIVDGRVDAVTSGTGTGGTLAGLYFTYLQRNSIYQVSIGRCWSVPEREESPSVSCPC